MPLQYYAFPKLWEYREGTTFQQDEAPPPSSVDVRQYLDEKYSTHWIGRAGSISLSVYSPELTPCIFLSRGCLKNSVYRDPPNTISKIKTRISQAVACINDDTLKMVSKIKESRLCILVKWGGGHFEHLLDRKEVLLLGLICIIGTRNDSNF